MCILQHMSTHSTTKCSFAMSQTHPCYPNLDLVLMDDLKLCHSQTIHVLMSDHLHSFQMVWSNCILSGCSLSLLERIRNHFPSMRQYVTVTLVVSPSPLPNNIGPLYFILLRWNLFHLIPVGLNFYDHGIMLGPRVKLWLSAKFFVQRICCIASSLPINFLSIEFIPFIFCFREKYVIIPFPLLKPAPVWLLQSFCMACAVSTYHLFQWHIFI